MLLSFFHRTAQEDALYVLLSWFWSSLWRYKASWVVNTVETSPTPKPSKMPHKRLFLWNSGLFQEHHLFASIFQKYPWPLAGPSIRLKSSNSSLKSFASLFRCLTTSSFASEELKSIIQSCFRFLWFKELSLLSCNWLPWFCRKFQAILHFSYFEFIDALFWMIIQFKMSSCLKSLYAFVRNFCWQLNSDETKTTNNKNWKIWQGEYEFESFLSCVRVGSETSHCCNSFQVTVKLFQQWINITTTLALLTKNRKFYPSPRTSTASVSTNPR